MYKYFISEIKKERNGEEANIPGSILFFGPRGMGKSTFYKAFAEEAECATERASINTTPKCYEQYQQSLNQIYQLADKAKTHFEETNCRTILFIDELTKLASKNSPIINELSEFLSTCSEKYHCTVFGATNYPEQLGLNFEDENIFPFRVALEPPTLEDKAKILEFYLNPRFGSRINYKNIAKILEEIEQEKQMLFSNSRIKYVCEYIRTEENVEQDIKTIIEKEEDIQPNITQKQLDLYSQNFTRLILNEA